MALVEIFPSLPSIYCMHHIFVMTSVFSVSSGGHYKYYHVQFGYARNEKDQVSYLIIHKLVFLLYNSTIICPW